MQKPLALTDERKGCGGGFDERQKHEDYAKSSTARTDDDGAHAALLQGED